MRPPPPPSFSTALKPSQKLAVLAPAYLAAETQLKKSRINAALYKPGEKPAFTQLHAK